MSTITCDNFINGAWVKGAAAVQSIHSPYDNRKLGEYSVPSLAQIDHALEEAQKAQYAWGRAPIKERSQVLFNLRTILLREAEAIASLKSLECGKTLAEAKAGLMKGIEVLEFALSIQNLDLGGKMEVSRGVTCEYRREPLGVVANITPFNFPAMVPMWTIPIALALGNSYVWKPSDKTPLTAYLLANCLKEAGLPSGVFTVLHGNAPTVEAIIAHRRVQAIGFVGSTKIAKLLSNLANDGVSIVLADHHVAEALSLAHRAMLLLDGKVATVGDPDSFQDHPLVRGRYLGSWSRAAPPLPTGPTDVKEA